MKRVILQTIYRLLSQLSLWMHNNRINRYKLAVGSSLLLLSTNANAQKKEKQDSIKDTSVQDSTTNDNSQFIFCYVIEEMPEFPNGMSAFLEYVKKEITKSYLQEVQSEGVEGKVIVSFTVDKDGSISDVAVLRSLKPSLDKIAIKIIKEMPKWKPGKQSGLPVQTKYTVPVSFKLPR